MAEVGLPYQGVITQVARETYEQVDATLRQAYQARAHLRHLLETLPEEDIVGRRKTGELIQYWELVIDRSKAVVNELFLYWQEQMVRLIELEDSNRKEETGD